MKYRYHWGIECPKCKDRIFSWHRHDFKYCSCKEVFVDGGFDYLRYSHCKDGTKPKIVKTRFIPSVRGNSA